MPQEGVRPAHPELTDLQLRCLEAFWNRRSPRQIAADLGTSEASVSSQFMSARRQLNVNSNADAATVLFGGNGDIKSYYHRETGFAPKRRTPNVLSKIDELIKGLFCRAVERTIFDMRKPDYAAVRQLFQPDVPTGDSADSMWLGRLELRSPERVTDFFNGGPRQQLAGKIKVMFVDARCGLIRTELIAFARGPDDDELVNAILSTAARCDARGIILASEADGGMLLRSLRWRDIHDKLHRKGDAIGVALLDHFILTAKGWRRLRSAR